MDSVTVPGYGGRIAVMACPGSDPPYRLEPELRALREWGAEVLVGLVESEELEILDVTDLPALAVAAGLSYLHLPIPDMCSPGREFEKRWREHGPGLRRRLVDGGAIAIHCWAGLGRTGTIAARLMVELGCAPELAIAQVRDARRGAIQTLQQEAHVLGCKALGG